MTDNFSVLAIEKCLLQELPKIFSPDAVAALDNTIIADIAAEPAGSKTERQRLTVKLRVLETSLGSLRRLERYQPLSMNFLLN